MAAEFSIPPTYFRIVEFGSNCQLPSTTSLYAYHPGASGTLPVNAPAASGPLIGTGDAKPSHSPATLTDFGVFPVGGANVKVVSHAPASTSTTGTSTATSATASTPASLPPSASPLGPPHAERERNRKIEKIEGKFFWICFQNNLPLAF